MAPGGVGVAAPPAGAPRWWALYFGAEAWGAADRRYELAAALVAYFGAASPGWEQARRLRRDDGGGSYAAPLDYGALRATADVPDLFAALDVAPYDALACLAAALHEVVLLSDEGRASLPALQPVPRGARVVVRLFNHAESALPFRALKSHCIGRIASVRGTVVRASVIKPLVYAMRFECARCGGRFTVAFPDGRHVPPTRCEAGDGCRSKSFLPDRDSAECVDWQRVRLQELNQGDTWEEARVPRTLECELTAGLVDACKPGDVVTICGVVKVISADADFAGAKAKQRNLMLLYVDALSVVRPARAQAIVDGACSPDDADAEDGDARRASLSEGGDARLGPLASVHFTRKELAFIAAFTEEYRGDQLRQLVHALCPAIYGHELTKAGLLLALVGGVHKHSGEGGKVPIRGDVHMLMVGDPGLGKSQLLRAAAEVAPRGLYVCGNTSSACGLTVAVARDTITGDYTFEAGAVVLADQGVCCVDEFDKMTQEHQALLEVMEQQTVSVTKAGLHASLPARTSVIAAANPAKGHYNRAHTVNENIKMSAPLLSRFDLIFILMDRPDEALDRHLSEHVVAQHAGGARAAGAQAALIEFNRTGGERRSLEDASSTLSRAPLLARLALNPVEAAAFEPVPSALLHKYIVYARRHVHPRLTRDAACVLQTFYLTLRERASGADSTPITARQLESMVRLAEARARIELREDVTREDAEDVVELMKASLYDRFVDEHGVVDFGRSGGRSGQRAEAKRFLGALYERSKREGRACFEMGELFALGQDLHLGVPDMEAFIERLNDAGDLLKVGRMYKLQCSDLSTQPTQPTGWR